MRRTFFTILLILLAAFYTQAQLVHRSMFYSAPTFYNPAMAAFSGGKYTFCASQRTQWKSLDADFKTSYATIGKTIVISRRGHIAGLEFSYMQDKAGGLKTTNGIFTFAPDMVFSVGDMQSRFRVGISAGFVTKSFDVSSFTFENQFTGTGFNPSMESGEHFTANKRTNPVFSFGFLYYGLPKALARRQVNPFLGMAFDNIIKSEGSFYQNAYSYQQSSRFVVHGGLRFDNRFAFEVTPLVNYMRESTTNDLSYGLNFKYNLPDFTSVGFQNSKRSISVGYLKHQNAGMVIYMGVDILNTMIGFSYDLNGTGLKNGTAPAEAYEVSIKYRIYGHNNAMKYTTGGKGFFFQNLPTPLF